MLSRSSLILSPSPSRASKVPVEGKESSRLASRVTDLRFEALNCFGVPSGAIAVAKATAGVSRSSKGGHFADHREKL